MSSGPIHARIDGPLILIGFGSIGRGLLPLLERHISFDKERFFVIDPDATHRALLDVRGINFVHKPVTEENYRDLLIPLLKKGPGQAVCISLAVEGSSHAIMSLFREFDVLYIDTVVEPWPGFYFNPNLGPATRSNYALREKVMESKKSAPGGVTAISCCGANPGMVSWLVKQALLNIARDIQIPFDEPAMRSEWSQLMQRAGVKGIHIAERDTQRRNTPRPRNVFVNTWSIEGFLSEGMQPAELGWGTHEKWMPQEAGTHDFGSRAAIYLPKPGADTRVRSWTPTAKSQFGLMVTHNESISIADYFTRRDDKGEVIFRPTCHYAYHPCDDAILSLYELFGQAGVPQTKFHIVDEH